MILTTGTMREEIARKDMEVLRGVVDRYSRKKHPVIWILIHFKDDPLSGGFKTSMQVHNRMPPVMLQTMCFKVDYKNSSAHREWILPLDDGMDVDGVVVGDIFMNAIKTGVPIQ